MKQIIPKRSFGVGRGDTTQYMSLAGSFGQLVFTGATGVTFGESYTKFPLPIDGTLSFLTVTTDTTLFPITVTLMKSPVGGGTGAVTLLSVSIPAGTGLRTVTNSIDVVSFLEGECPFFKVV